MKKGWQYNSPVPTYNIFFYSKYTRKKLGNTKSNILKTRLSQLIIQSFSTSAFLLSFLCFWTTEEVEIFPVVLNNHESPRFLEV